MSSSLGRSRIAWFSLALIILADALSNVYIGRMSSTKTLTLPSIDSISMTDKMSFSRFDRDLIDSLFGLTKVVRARNQARELQAQKEREAELAAQEPAIPERVLVLGEEQFRLFGVSSVGARHFAIFSVDLTQSQNELVELELGGSLSVLDGLAELRLGRVERKSVSLIIHYFESGLHVPVDLFMFKGPK